MRLSDAEKVARAVGRRIAELRRDQELTQEEFAERLNVSIQHLRRIELAKTNLTLRTLVEIANALSVPPIALLEPPRTLGVGRGRPRKAP